MQEVEELGKGREMAKKRTDETGGSHPGVQGLKGRAIGDNGLTIDTYRCTQFWTKFF